jgi:iron complex transport system permease protein
MNRWLVPSLILVLLIVMAASLLAGTIWLSPAEVLGALSDDRQTLAGLIVFEVRLPRVVLAALIGAILGLSGAVMQGLLRNPLAEPGLIGTTAGASLGAVIAIYYGFSASFALASPLLGLAGALFTTGIAFALSRNGGTLALILAGSAISSVALALVELALNLAPNPYAAFEIVTWILGSLAERSWDHVRLATPFIVVGGAMLLSTGKALDALALGEAQAESLGIPVDRVRIVALLGTAIGVGAATSVSGSIGFVGLVAPHLVRPLVGQRPASVLVPAALVGGIMVVLADIATRVIPIGQGISLGVFISLVGAPFFLWLVLHVRRQTA